MGQYSNFINEIAYTGKFRGANMIDFDDAGQEMYISFQTLLKFINDYVTLATENGTPIIRIDWESDKPYLAYSTSVSFNLLNCYIYNDIVGTSDGQFYQNDIFTFFPFRQFTDTATTYSDIEETQIALSSSSAISAINGVIEGTAQPRTYSVYPVIGNINYIYLNCGMIAKILADGSTNPDNIISIRQLLQDVCDKVGKALGSINDFQVVVDDETNVLTIVDFNQKRIPGLSNITKRPVTTIAAQGPGTFAVGISAQSNITPELATTIAVGAQANGNQVGYEATTFSRLSEGFTDRIYASKKVSGNEYTTATGSALLEQQQTQFQEIQNSYITVIANQQENNKGTITYKSDDPLNLENTCVEFYRYLQGAYFQDKQIASTFIPVKLDLTLTGLSGMKIFQRFRLSSDVLPFSYKDQFDFIITGLSHEVSNNNKWTTKISSLTVLREN